MRPTTDLRVLFAHHVGIIGGSSRSLLELIKGLRELPVRSSVICPRGALSETLRGMGVPVINCLGLSQFDDTRYSHYRRLRWIILLRELALMFPTVAALIRARQQLGQFDVVHVNEYTLPFVAWIARRLFPTAAVVVHARSLQCGERSARGRFLGRLFARNVDLIIAIDENVRSTLPAALRVEVVHNGFAMSANPKTSGESTQPERPFTAAMVGILSRSKGCREFLEAARICSEQGLPIRFVFFGFGAKPARWGIDWLLSLLGIWEDFGDEAREFVLRHGLSDRVHFEPFTPNLPQIYQNVDVVCFPSHLDAPGRPIFEAGFFGVPSIAAISAPMPDTFRPEESGIVIPAGDAEKLAAAIARLFASPDDRARMGTAARALAVENFDAARNARKIYSAYLKLFEARRQGARHHY